MIIKFQIYSILHPIPSKGILESHTNVLLNRKRILNFYFTIFFSGTGKREVPSTYLRNASVYTPRPPQPKANAWLLRPEVFPRKDRDPYLPACSSLPGSSVPTSSNLNFSVLFLPGIRTGGRGAGEVASGPGPAANSAGDPVGQCLNLYGLSFPICNTRGVGLDSRTEGTLPVTFLEEDRTPESEIRERSRRPQS